MFTASDLGWIVMLKSFLNAVLTVAASALLRAYLVTQGPESRGPELWLTFFGLVFTLCAALEWVFRGWHSDRVRDIQMGQEAAEAERKAAEAERKAAEAERKAAEAEREAALEIREQGAADKIHAEATRRYAFGDGARSVISRVRELGFQTENNDDALLSIPGRRPEADLWPWFAEEMKRKLEQQCVPFVQTAPGEVPKVVTGAAVGTDVV